MRDRHDEGGNVSGEPAAALFLRPAPESRGGTCHALDASHESAVTAKGPGDDVDAGENDALAQPPPQTDPPEQPPVTYWEFVAAVRTLRSNR